MKKIIYLFLTAIGFNQLDSSVQKGIQSTFIPIYTIEKEREIKFEKAGVLARMLIVNECLEGRLSVTEASILQKSHSIRFFWCEEEKRFICTRYFSIIRKYIYDNFYDEIDELYKLAKLGLWAFKNSQDPLVERFLKIRIGFAVGKV